ncbi:MAG: ribonuclease [Bacteroidetes bacterium HGW-Bacteroidetes-15]|nr:MAG: ribonuclease [Bacteroidetes bacterium HGW-Bacteroidetes-15]
MKRISLLFQFLIISIIIVGQPPENYYTTTQGKYGQELMVVLNGIIKNHTAISYSEVWTAFHETDAKDDGKVWDMYTNCVFTFGDDQDTGSGGTTECDVYNREHSFPASWFGGSTSSIMYTDLFHLYPTDKKVNATRANYPFGEVGSASYTSNNGSKLGSSSYTGYSGIVFEPIDEYKGDFARSYFYMATRYYDLMHSWSTPITNGTQYPAFNEWVINLLTEWHESDPVSEKEVNRNNAIYNNFQHNRNPYIDHPEFIARIWGDETNAQTIAHTFSIKIFPNPASDWVKVSTNEHGPIEVNIYNLIGESVKRVILKSNMGPFEIDTNDLTNGVYLVRVITNSTNKTFRLSINK